MQMRGEDRFSPNGARKRQNESNEILQQRIQKLKSRSRSLSRIPPIPFVDGGCRGPAGSSTAIVALLPTTGFDPNGRRCL